MKTFNEWLQEGQRDYSATGMPHYSRQTGQSRQSRQLDREEEQERGLRDIYYRQQRTKREEETSELKKSLLNEFGVRSLRDLIDVLDKSYDSIVITFDGGRRVYADEISSNGARLSYSAPGQYIRFSKLADLNEPPRKKHTGDIPWAIIDKFEWASSLGLQPEIEELRQKGKEENIEQFHSQLAKKSAKAKQWRAKGRKRGSGTECPSCKTNIPMSSYRTVVDRDGEDMLVPPANCPNCNVQLAR
jgi:hypothetical protein